VRSITFESISYRGVETSATRTNRYENTAAAYSVHRSTELIPFERYKRGS